jgi:PilZ domain
MGYQAQRERKRKLQERMRYKTLSGFVEKRKFPRIEVRWPVTVITEKGSVKGEARNISAGGVYILFKHPIENLALNETHLLLMDAAGQIIEVMGKPVWSNPDIPPGMGLCFVEISEGDRKFLREAIQKSAKE